MKNNFKCWLNEKTLKEMFKFLKKDKILDENIFFQI